MTTKYNVIFKELSDESFEAISERLPSITFDEIEIPPQMTRDGFIPQTAHVAGKHHWEPFPLEFKNSDALALLIQTQVKKQYDILYKTLSDKDKRIANAERYKFNCELVNDDFTISIKDAFIHDCDFMINDNVIKIILIFDHATVTKNETSGNH